MITTTVLLAGQEVRMKICPEKLSDTFQTMYSHDMSIIRSHMFGLRELLKLHGGLESLPISLARHIRKYNVLYYPYRKISNFDSMDICYAAAQSTLPALEPGPCDGTPPLIKAVSASQKYLDSAFLTQRYRSQFQPLILKTYINLSLALTLQTCAFHAIVALEPNALTRVEEASAFRYWAINKIMTLHCDDEDVHKTGYAVQIYPVTSIQAICRVVVPINVMQDELSPYGRHRPPFTVTLMNDLYDTLNYKLNVEECWAKCFDVMLWATLSGAYISRGNTQEKELWFSTQVVIGVRGRERTKVQIEGRWEWSAIKSLLQRFYWNEELVGEEFKVQVHQEPHQCKD
ncbi:MAG: hypothetical protein Q9195_009634 [Heterodermia aff. obscurata]